MSLSITRREGGGGLWKTLALWTGRICTSGGLHDLTTPRKTPFLTETWNLSKVTGGKGQHPNCVCVLVAQSWLTLCEPWAAACQAPLSMEFSRQEYWSVLPFPSPGDLPNPGIKPKSSTLREDSLLSEPPGKRSIQTTSHKTVFHVLCQSNCICEIKDFRAPRNNLEKYL